MTIGLAAATLLAAACGSAQADQVAPRARRPITKPVVVATPSPYSIDLIDERGNTLDTYERGGRFYVLGSAGQRYTVRVKNPTARRIEAILSVDGLDAIDGKTADFRNKRGYVVEAHGELRVDGFRVSNSNVATFRFSSVRNSYAGRKGKARNVGVIGVAIFEERAAPRIIVDDVSQERAHNGRFRTKKRAPRNYDRDSADEARFGVNEAPAADVGVNRGPGKAAGATATPAKPAPRRRVSRTASRTRCSTGRCGGHARPERPGLGTQFGERRYSRVSFTRFVRANANRPTAIAELRYNDAAGLTAMGIRLSPVSPYDTRIRETASPFPDSGFASPPIGWR